MKTPEPEILYGIFCEFVRLEKSGQVTPVGIWGESCQLETNATAVLQSLAFYSYIRNLGHLPYKAKIQFTFPGNPTPIVFEVPVKGEPIQLGQNLIFNLVGVSITEPGDVVALLQIETNTPTEKEFRLHMDFRPEATP